MYTSIITAVVIVAALGLLIGLILAFASVIFAVPKNEKTEKGEYCVVLDLHGVPAEEPEQTAAFGSVAVMLAEEISNGMTLREAQESLIQKGEKKNAVKQAALRLKKAVE